MLMLAIHGELRNNFARKGSFIMKSRECVELCENCPLRTMFPTAPLPVEKDLHLKKVGESAIPHTWIDRSDGSAHFEIDNLHGPKQVEVVILPEGTEIGPAFYFREAAWNSGAVEEAFENCTEPEQKRSGFLKLSKTAVCGALSELDPYIV